MTEAVVSSPQQSRVAVARVDQLGQGLAALIRQAQHQHTKEHKFSQHQLLSNKQTKGLNPWKLKKVAWWSSPWPGGEGQAPEAYQKLTRSLLGGEGQAGVEPGGEGQARSKQQPSSKQ
jgi:hypothetical protein